MKKLIFALLLPLFSLANAYENVPYTPAQPTPYENAQQQQQSSFGNRQEDQRQQRQTNEDVDKAARNYNSQFGSQFNN